MNYREQLNFIEQNKLSISDICVAGSADAIFSFEYTEEEFERLCGAIHRAWMASEYIGEDEIASAINSAICGKLYTVDEICEMSKWDLIIAANDGCWPERKFDNDEDYPF